MTMGLAWQQAPLGENPAGRFLLEQPLPAHILYAEPAGRRMRVELVGAIVAYSDEVTLLHETGRYPVAYFPSTDVDSSLLRPSSKRTQRPQLGETVWWSLEIEHQRFEDVAWSHHRPPRHAQLLAGRVAFVWNAMDAFYEEDEPILGHAADPYHRVDIRSSRRRLTVRFGGELIADTHAPLVVFETGFAPRWYAPRRDVAAGVLESDPRRTLCPYKGVAHYFDVVAGEQRARAAAWAYPEALPESARLAGYVSFDPAQVEVALDGEQLLPAAHQRVVASGTDRNLAA
jgi:uncharacterized protein (DUF427 family)